VEGSAQDRGSSKACLQRYRRVRVAACSSTTTQRWAVSSCVLCQALPAGVACVAH
jgi:hypothetical protein